MAQVKLELEDKTDDELKSFVGGHITAMASNPTYPTPAPTIIAYKALADAFEADVDRVVELTNQLSAAVSQKNSSRAALEAGTRTRGSYVQETSEGDKTKILTSGFDVRDPATPTTSLDMPEDVRASIGDNAGDVDLQWDRVERARGYLVEYRLHTDGTPWTRFDAVPTRSRTTVTGLVSGKEYAFRVRATGPNGLVSPWSDEAVKMAA